MSGKPAFPSPAPAPVLISDSGRGDSDSEMSPQNDSPPSRPHQLASVTVIPMGPQNDEELEILSIHEQLVDEAIARSPETARASDALAAIDGTPAIYNSTAYLQSEHGQLLQERLRNLAAAFRARSLQAKQLVMQPPPAEKEGGLPAPKDDGVIKPPPPPEETKKKAPPPPPPKKPEPPPPPPPVKIQIWKLGIKIPEWFYKIPRPESFDPHSRIYLGWLTVVSICFVYNAIVIPYRAAFYDPTPDTIIYWFIADYISDLIFLIDLIIWKPSIRTFINGIEVNDKKEITRKYVASDDFWLDFCCLTPLDLFYLVPNYDGNYTYNPLLRILRLIKIHSYWELLDRIDLLFTNPYYFRVLRSVAYMMYLIHVNACIFYWFSYLKGFSANDWFIYNNENPICRNASKQNPQQGTPTAKCNFPGEYNAYIFCLFFSVSMVTIIGNLNFPQYVSEMIYSTILWFIGVFVFATLVGQIRDVLKAMTRQEDEFYEVMDAIVEHMHTLKIPKELQDRVRTWLLFNWEQQKTIDEGKLLDGLPVKLRTDLAMEVHFSTIHKVQLFRDVDKKVLEELLLRLKPSVYLPNDYICKRGEIGKEMYIIKSGVLEVVLPDGRVAVTLSPGSVFGEISLLALAGGNRRTADVRSKGFSNLYVLSKADLNDVMKDYPETLDALKLKAQELMNKGKPPAEKPPTPPPIEIIPTRPPTPEMVRVALSILKPDSEIRRRLSQSAMELTLFRDHKPGNSDEDDVELVLASESSDPLTDNRGRTPDPTVEVTAEIVNIPLAEVISSEVQPEKTRSTESLLAKQSVRRRRSAATAPSESSSESEDTPGPTGQARTRRKKPHRGASHQSGEQSAKSLDSPALVGNGTPIFPLTKSSENLMKDRTPTPMTSMSKSSSLTNLKRRLFNAPKVYPISMDQADRPELEPPILESGGKKRVFDFGPPPEPGNVVGPTAPSNISFSDYEYTSNLSDSFAAVTFSSPDSP